MATAYQILFFFIAYLLGSIPTSVWVGKLFYGIDIRQHGSGNPGATNTFRVLGIKAGIPVLIFDTFKGWFAVKLSLLIIFYEPGTNQFVNYQILLGVCAVIGHIFPVFAKFKGGKGVATLLGMVVAIQPYPALAALGIFVITLLLSRYVSLSSMLSGIAFPFLVIFFFKIELLSLIVFSAVVSILLIVTHRKNIVRLINGNELKANLFRKRHKKESSS
ncbi:MAG: acyl-phosphate glycerol 3-phosphate acyltransferase [Bacteroidetes bacterium RIFOXYA12_FULL_35_11]|nr:MAG: acyl-phosphate glycerol 3-phosphate acyltransferase [Bacteroidetes bacterium GWF2_35_48]OFY72778.1 MAG: acyl-phosphate glycerol 3-phosphate acyltransferase [Bacteroidetes bacterium RIFOXYA12_FULL_35_11]OFY95370.1 MAG: acyl-phosphate glycerol 3-phosphate acyltransferase [Bacteroidetes bacterium RIFOXYC12_FULL_35_7]HBX52238.1 acyl-phosphate glycerol 3-phosphate acyltransferase [Bacteroidales bacterium]